MKRLLLIVAICVVACNDDEVTQDRSGRRVIAWVDPMRSMGPPHLYESKHPGVAPDCNMKLVPLYAEAKPAATPALRLNAKIAVAERRNLSRTFRTSGRVTIDERRTSQIHAKFEGFVSAVYVNVTGQVVRRGDPLLSIYSPDLLATQNELIVAQRNESDLGRTLAGAARTRLRLWDMTAADIDRVAKSGKPERDVVLRSPASGVVLVKNVVAGARVMPSDTLYEIADLTRVWVVADVYESELPHVRLGSSAKVIMNGETHEGRISFITPVIAAATRTASVRIELENHGTLRPDTYAEVVIDEPIGNVVAVPESAVMNTGLRSVVFAARDDGSFEPRNVMLGAKVEGFYEIRDGLKEGTRVAADANFLVDSESRLKSMRGMP